MDKKICLVCQKEFFKKPNISKNNWIKKTFCSYKCRTKVLPPPRQGVITGKNCVTCNKTFFVKGIKRRNTQMTCSKKCIRGELHPNWQGGKTPINQILRNTIEYNEWRKSVYKRDNWTCKICKKKQKHPIAHHIKSFNDYIELRFVVENGVTLCRSCHKIIHKEIGLDTRFLKKV